MQNVIIKPIITEKMTEQGEGLNKFGFYVRPDVNKIQVKEAVETTYGVSVDSVNIMNVFGKASTRFTKTGIISGRTSDKKKAIVTLAEGDTIDLYSSI